MVDRHDEIPLTLPLLRSGPLPLPFHGRGASGVPLPLAGEGGAQPQAGRVRGLFPSLRQSLSSALIDVEDRVFASTRFTITAQASDGPIVPSASGLPGRLPGTTTE